MPILISIQQMRNLYMSFTHTPECDYITCEAFGLKDYPIPISTSNHLLLNLVDLKSPPKRVSCQFLTDNVTQLRSAKIVQDENQPINCRTPTGTSPSGLDAAAMNADCDEEALWDDDPYGGGGFEQPETVDKKPPVLGVPDGNEEAQDEDVPKVARRITGKSEDPVQAAALRKIHDKLRNEAELFKLHQKHYHMSVNSFEKRTSMLKIPKDIYDLYEKVVKKCGTCSKLEDGPPKAKVSGMRAEVFGDLLLTIPRKPSFTL